MRPSRRAAVAVAILVCTATSLSALGRRPWCRCGTFRPWVGHAWGPENSQHLADPYSFTHVTHGVLLYLVLQLVAPAAPLATRALVALAAESGWEVLENTDFVIDRYRAATIALGYHGDTIVNSFGDIGSCLLGFVLAARLPPAVTVGVTLLQEAALLLWIRDSLLVNVVMLVHPIAAVTRWQGAGSTSPPTPIGPGG
jgi:uncharacterized protein DUF2585